ncbi:unnamed protein product [Prorocentrum cordatum]|uniref:Uncharacterized protein n=1 Tax=Prorocentrum cordatum TaxID=2364126 RepID=A0ABN9VDS9_9DINO|nr:unnamed protein product [Polarella glacialis]
MLERIGITTSCSAEEEEERATAVPSALRAPAGPVTREMEKERKRKRERREGERERERERKKKGERTYARCTPLERSACLPREPERARLNKKKTPGAERASEALRRLWRWGVAS